MTVRRKWFNREVFGWAMFDFANQAFTLVILTAMFQVYFVQHIVPPEQFVSDAGEIISDTSRGRRLWATSGIITQIIIIAASPILGALADFSGAKKKLLFITYLGCILFTTGLGLIPPGAVGFGMALFITAYLFYAAGENFMASFLPELASHRMMGKVSAFGWTMGYIGGLLCLGGAVVITALTENGPTGYRLVCLWAGVFFLFGALPTFLLLREKKRPESMPADQTIATVGFHRLASTFHELRHYRLLFRYLAIMCLYFAGMQIVYWFGGTLTKELFGFSDQKMGLFILQLTVTAIIGALLTARYQDRLGAKNFILLCLLFWAVTILIAATATREWVFWTVGNAVGLGIGALGTASRAMVGLFSPPHKAAEFFGFYGLAHKLAAIIGLGAITAAEFIFRGNFSLVVASGSIFFIAGFALMLSIDEKTGRVGALRAERAFRRRVTAGSA